MTDFDTARDLQRELDDFAGMDYPDEDAWQQTHDGEPPTLADIDQVNRTLRRIRACEREAVEISSVAAAELQRITAWAEDRRSGVERQRAWLERAVEGWMRAHNATTGAKTVELPNGKLKLRAARQSVVITTPDLTGIPPEFKRTRVELDKTAVKQHAVAGPSAPAEEGYLCFTAVTAEGETLPGVFFVEAIAATFSVDVSETHEPAEPE